MSEEMSEGFDPSTTRTDGNEGAQPVTGSGLGWPQDPIAAQQEPLQGVASGLGWPSSVVSRETPLADDED